MSILETTVIDFDKISSALLRTKLQDLQKDISKISTLTHIKQRRLKKIFTGKRHPTMVELISLARVMNFSIGEFYSDVEKTVDTYIATGAAVRFSNAKYGHRPRTFFVLGMIFGVVLSWRLLG